MELTITRQAVKPTANMNLIQMFAVPSFLTCIIQPILLDLYLNDIKVVPNQNNIIT